MTLLRLMCCITRGCQRMRYDLKDMAWSVVVLLTIAAITFVILGM